MPQQSSFGSKFFFVSLGFLRIGLPLCGVTTSVLPTLPPIQFFDCRMKHVEVDYHFVRERVASQQLDVRINLFQRSSEGYYDQASSRAEFL
jgi:hypothetical protein